MLMLHPHCAPSLPVRVRVRRGPACAPAPASRRLLAWFARAHRPPKATSGPTQAPPPPPPPHSHSHSPPPPPETPPHSQTQWQSQRAHEDELLDAVMSRQPADLMLRCTVLDAHGAVKTIDVGCGGQNSEFGGAGELQQFGVVRPSLGVQDDNVVVPGSGERRNGSHGEREEP